MPWDVPLQYVWRRSRLVRKRKWRWRSVRTAQVSRAWVRSDRRRSLSDLLIHRVQLLQVCLVLLLHVFKHSITLRVTLTEWCRQWTVIRRTSVVTMWVVGRIRKNIWQNRVIALPERLKWSLVNTKFHLYLCVHELWDTVMNIVINYIAASPVGKVIVSVILSVFLCRLILADLVEWCHSDSFLLAYLTNIELMILLFFLINFLPFTNRTNKPAVAYLLSKNICKVSEANSQSTVIG